MEVSSYAELVARQLHPYPYTDRVANPGTGMELLLTCKKAILARYALAACSWKPGVGAEEFLSTNRNAVARKIGAVWMFREVGLYLVVCGVEAEWNAHASQCAFDKAGLHAVIIQAVHFVDLQTGASLPNQSAWGPVKFGGVDSVAERIKSILVDQ